MAWWPALPVHVTLSRRTGFCRSGGNHTLRLAIAIQIGSLDLSALTSQT